MSNVKEMNLDRTLKRQNTLILLKEKNKLNIEKKFKYSLSITKKLHNLDLGLEY